MSIQQKLQSVSRVLFENITEHIKLDLKNYTDLQDFILHSFDPYNYERKHRDLYLYGDEFSVGIATSLLFKINPMVFLVGKYPKQRKISYKNIELVEIIQHLRPCIYKVTRPKDIQIFGRYKDFPHIHLNKLEKNKINDNFNPFNDAFESCFLDEIALVCRQEIFRILSQQVEMDLLAL
jgi:hypothetical protein